MNTTNKMLACYAIACCALVAFPSPVFCRDSSQPLGDRQPLGVVSANGTTSPNCRPSSWVAWVLPAVTATGSIVPPDWVVGAGEVTDCSPQADKDGYAVRMVTVSVSRPIIHARLGQIVSFELRQRVLRPGIDTTDGAKRNMDFVQIAEGNLVLVVLSSHDGVLKPREIYRIEDNDLPIAIMETYAAWDGLSGQAQLDAIAASVVKPDSPVRGTAMDGLARRAQAQGKRAWAFDILGKIALAKGVEREPVRNSARTATVWLYDLQEPDGVSSRVLDLWEAMAGDTTLSVQSRQGIIYNLGFRAHGVQLLPNGDVQEIFRPRVADMVDRLTKSATDPCIKAEGARVSASLQKYRAHATKVVEN